MSILNQNILDLARGNTFFRKEINTNEHSQIVLMSLEAGDDIGEETHDVDQILFFVEGYGVAILNGERSAVSANSLVVVPAGVSHNFLNIGEGPLKLVTIYSPPEHSVGTIQKSKADAMVEESIHRPDETGDWGPLHQQ